MMMKVTVRRRQTVYGIVYYAEWGPYFGYGDSPEAAMRNLVEVIRESAPGVAHSPRCPACDGELAVTTLYGHAMRVLEGRFAGMFDVHCIACSWDGYAPPEVARQIRRRRGMYAQT